MFSVIKGRQKCWFIIIQTVLFNDGFNVQVKLLMTQFSLTLKSKEHKEEEDAAGEY